MDVVLIRSEGRGGEAEVEVDGCALAVVDELSPADRASRPGPLAGASLEVLTIAHLSGRARGDEEPGLVREWGWRYRGTGEVVSTDPLRAELGPFTLSVDLPRDLELAVGDRVTIAIDRIVLRRA
ncbi:MAG: hypothetical protein QNK04_16720 [Myxococcota bacterium]|nr:hypothetical protein [Myxococcota bacterium]